MHDSRDAQALQKFINGFAKVMEGSQGLFLFVWEMPGYIYHVWPVRGLYGVTNGTRYTIEEYVERVVYSADRSLVLERYKALAANTLRQTDFSCRVVDVDGTEHWVSMHLRNALDDQGRVCLMGGYSTSAEGMRRRDEVTGLFNQSQCVADYAAGLPGEEGFLLRVDIDDMTFVNELYGRPYGDALLRELASISQRAKRGQDRLYRADDDCFILMLPGAQEEDVKNIYNTVSRELAAYCHSRDTNALCTVSAGAAHWPGDSTEYEQLSRYSASALHTAKLAGKNTLVFFQVEEYDEYQSDLSLRADLRSSVEKGFEGFWLVYQPQVTLATGRVKSAEALLRWNSAERGFVPPNRFIPLLESGGLIIKVGRWVIEHAIAQCAEWRKTEPDFVMGINLSYLQLENDDVVQVVRECLEKHGLPGSSLVLELTESEQLHNYHYFNKQLEPLHELGVSVAIDDFGTGYSSLGYFKELHINQVKIDRCFVTRIRESEYDYRLIEFITNLAHSTHMEVCVEGVEVAEELRALMPLAPDLIQGYYFGKPVPPEEFAQKVLTSPQMMDEKLVAQARQLAEEGRDLSPMSLPAVDEFKNLLDTLPDIIHISELDSGRLIYLNRAGRLEFGVRDYDGKACFEVLHGRGRPCKYCWSLQLERNEFQSWYAENKRFGGTYENRVKLIPWDGRMARLSICALVDKQQKTNLVGEDKKLLSCMRSVLSAPSVKRAVETALWYIADIYAPDRVHVYEYDEQTQTATKRYSRVRDDVPPEREQFWQVDGAEFPDWLELLRSNQCIEIQNMDIFLSKYPVEYAALEKRHMLCPVMAVPFSAQGRFSGFLLIDSPAKGWGSTLFASTVGGLIASELQKPH